MYAILDIETTGGQFNEEGITEIAIYRYDGHEIVDQFISLVNPEIPIQPFVVKLTGISNAMLQSAPKFFEVAKRIIEITEGCIIVAHNTVFDYRVLRLEFKRLGYDFQAQTLDTVELAQKLIPDMPSYSLGKLSRALGIPVADRHRASGDAMATVKLFKMLLDKDVEKTIISTFIKTEVEKGIAPKLLDIVDKLPSRCGIYYVHREDGKIIYIGKSRNIKKRVNQHFTGNQTKSKKIQLEVFDVTYEETGSELIALLKESQEVKVNKPKYNRAQSKTNLQWALYQQTDKNGYINLVLDKYDRNRQEITAFNSIIEAKTTMHRLTQRYELCPKLTGLDDAKTNCQSYTVKTCDGACIGEISADVYNLRVQAFLNDYTFTSENMIILDRGRNVGERSAVLIENGIYKGYAFFDLNYQVLNSKVLHKILVPMPHNRDTTAIIRMHLRRNPKLKIVNF
ncbi:GIY-YIG nuclease family protein [Flavobacterium sp. MAH-1]|uniref:GIY-YIG nuclease family protein n=1 Tax=Flavobacterium agri TaxID=2743471 RepID=A0A7Y9C7E5_9FLAO|nr:exonuclease domain-containing protein [Flavobacterium agri]NUY82280.1 GIY-YIG nuclease family protein [Flavobacterium agri]NYA72304.1 GIY-YIG nuclease family protein [Flavobacterium agri]